EHPLTAALDVLFREEEQRFEAVLDAVRTATGRCDGLVAAWLYGSVARGPDRATRDVDIAVVGEPEGLPKVEETLREALWETEDRLAIAASVVAVDTDDVLRLAAENDPWWTGLVQDALRIAGDPPDVLLERLKRRQKPERRKAS